MKKLRVKPETAEKSEAPLVKNPRRNTKPDLTLTLLRFILIAAVALAISAFYFPFWREPLSRAGEIAQAISIGEIVAAYGIFLAALLFAFSVRKADEWERAVILRFGKFHKVKGPGLYFLAPVADRVAETVDIRIRVTDFSAQETLTGDSVTVDVDAICFWLVWDPQKAALEVEDYREAVILSSKTALRSAISGNSLSDFLEHNEKIAKQVREEVDRKTTEWGITVQHIEITDIQIPEALQDSLSRVAQAAREKESRILLADAEIEIARKLEEAVAVYARNEPAMKLKILSILNEGLKAGSSMMLVPGSIADELKTRDVFGLEALHEVRKENRTHTGGTE